MQGTSWLALSSCHCGLAAEAMGACTSEGCDTCVRVLANLASSFNQYRCQSTQDTWANPMVQCLSNVKNLRWGSMRRCAHARACCVAAARPVFLRTGHIAWCPAGQSATHAGRRSRYIPWHLQGCPQRLQGHGQLLLGLPHGRQQLQHQHAELVVGQQLRQLLQQRRGCRRWVPAQPRGAMGEACMHACMWGRAVAACLRLLLALAPGRWAGASRECCVWRPTCCCAPGPCRQQQPLWRLRQQLLADLLQLPQCRPHGLGQHEVRLEATQRCWPDRGARRRQLLASPPPGRSLSLLAPCSTHCSPQLALLGGHAAV
jgi:hypothetical protein